MTIVGDLDAYDIWGSILSPAKKILVKKEIYILHIIYTYIIIMYIILMIT